jgi:signal transduction histidine kinase/CheY-like chemotaxis protein
VTDARAPGHLERTCALVATLLADGSPERRRAVQTLLMDLEIPLLVLAGAEHQVQLKNAAWLRLGGTAPIVATARLDAVAATGEPYRFVGGLVYPIARGVVIACVPHASADVRDQFFAIVSHELRAPITAILIWEQILRDEKIDPALRARALDAIHDSATQQAQLVADLLDISRAMSGKLHVDHKVLVFEHVLTAAVQAAEAAASAKQQELVCSVAPDLGLVAGDAIRLAQVLGNLLSNAVKHTGDHGRIVVTARRTESNIEVEIADTGRGITAEFLPRVFDPFSQADEGTLDGLGLGLAIAHELVTAHDGTLTAASPGAGCGATFTLVLPLVDEPQPARVLRPTAARLSGIRLLVVDDDRRVLDALQVLLEQSGAVVDIAESASAGMGAIANAMPDAILSDIAMPGEDGYTFVDRVRKLRGARQVPAIAITAHASEADRARALASGFDLYLTKPLRVDRLISEVVRLVDDARASRSFT